jgi:ribonucleoside-diphosphate reductase alpha chain
MSGKEIFVIKRNGASEPLDFEKINQVLLWATEGINGVSASDIAMNAQIQLYDGITTNEIHKVLIQSSVDLITEKTPNYQIVGGNLLNYYIRKDIFGSDNDNLPHLMEVIQKNVDRGIYDKKLLQDYTEDEINKFNKIIKHKRDYNFVYAGLQQLIDKYLLKDRNTGEVFETPQYMYMLIAMTLFADGYTGDERIKKVQSYYNDISLFKINLPTPIMCGVRTPNRQYSSCTLIDVGDSLDSIFNSNSAVGYYTAKRAGIGLNFGRIRALGDSIRGGEVVHTGVVPFLKMFESTTKSCTQNGVRGGGSTTHFPFWHREIREILVLKNNRGTDDNRVRKMDYSIQFNRLFYRRFIKDEELTLFSPNDCPDLYSAFYSGDNDLFEELYEKYERKTSIEKKKVRARDLMNSFVQERIGTGRIYLMNVDHVNEHSSFIDPVYMSNLCQEITLPTTPLKHIDDDDDSESEIALCVLSAINVGEIKDLSELEELVDNIVRGLDFVITNQDYPVKAATKMLKRRSIGIGVTNLAYYLAKNGFTYDDEGALPLVDELMEHIQYYAIKASVNLAKEFGPCEWFDRTKYSQGILPIDTYSKNVDKIVNRLHTLDWEQLRKDVLEFGMRNSTLTALMPCESSAVATNSTNGMEPIRALVTTKKSKKGLLRQVAPEIHKLKNKYQLAYDLDGNRGIINIQAVIQKWIDQSISSNHYYDIEKYDGGEIPMSEIVDDILYSYKMGLKTLYYANTNDGKSDRFTEKKKDENVDLIEEEEYIDDDMSCAGGACSI